MRVSSDYQYQQTLFNMQSSFEQIAKLQIQITSGKRLQVASDDPTAMATVMGNKVQDKRYTNDIALVQDASAKLQSSVDALKSVQDLLTNVKSMALQANNVTTPAATNATLAKQVNTAIDQLLQFANQTLPDGSYLFSGTASKSTPFSVTSTNAAGQPTAISYNGSNQNSEVIVSRSVTASTMLSGQDVFQSRVRGATTFVGQTGAAAGTGTDNATGQGQLLVQHLATSFAGTSGVAAGTSSAAKDTVIGPAGAHSLVINDTSGTGASGTVSLNGGPAIAFTNLDSDLKVTGPAGEVVYINTTGITPGFNGSVAMTATGSLSVDGGATSIPIDFSSNQIVTDGTSGKITNVNSTNIRQAGTDQVEYQGTSDIFQTLIALRDTIANTQNLSGKDRSAVLQKQIAELDRTHSSIGDTIGSQAVQSESLTNLKDYLTSLQLNLGQSTDNLEATDTAAAVVSLQQQMDLYQASLQIAAKVNTLSLMNFIN